MLRATRNLWRLLAIGRILARHDVLIPFELMGLGGMAAAARLLSLRRADDSARRPGERLALALQELGPSFIKLGQGLSTRADLLGEEVAADLSALQDRLPPFPGTHARATIERELGQPLDALAKRSSGGRCPGRRVNAAFGRPGSQGSRSSIAAQSMTDPRPWRTEPKAAIGKATS